MKKLSLHLLAALFFIGCQKQLPEQKSAAETTPAVSAKPGHKINVCHYDAATSSYALINISINAWPAHEKHGDVRLDDQDKDGYVPTNACGFGNMGDLNDLVATIYPGAPEICGNGIDDNGDGMVDECCLTTVNICGVNWMDKNFDCTTYSNGDEIPQVTNAAEWAALTTGAWCYYNNDPLAGAVYGKLYNYYAIADPRGIAPAGWHVPDFEDFEALKSCIGFSTGADDAGGKLKEAGTAHWLSPNVLATNSTGFTGLPGGYRDIFGSFVKINERGSFWTTADYIEDSKQIIDLFYSTADFPYLNAFGKKNGASLRLVKD